MAAWIRRHRIWERVRKSNRRHRSLHCGQRDSNKWDYSFKHAVEIRANWTPDLVAKAPFASSICASGPFLGLAILWRVSIERYHRVLLKLSLWPLLVLTIKTYLLYLDCRKQPDSIMLVEPGMLLIYRSADKQPRLTDMLVEYLYDYVNIYDPSRVDEAYQSV